MARKNRRGRPSSTSTSPFSPLTGLRPFPHSPWASRRPWRVSGVWSTPNTSQQLGGRKDEKATAPAEIERLGEGASERARTPTGSRLSLRARTRSAFPSPSVASPLGSSLRERAAPLHNSEVKGERRGKYVCVRAHIGSRPRPFATCASPKGAASFTLAWEEGIVFSKWLPGL